MHKIGLASLILLTACAGAQRQVAPEPAKIVACTTEKQWTSNDGKTGIHVCFAEDGSLHYVGRPLPEAPAKPAATKKKRKVEKES